MTGDGAKVPHADSPEGRHRTWLQGVAHERERIVRLGRAYIARKVESSFSTAHLSVFIDAIERGEEP